MIHGIPHGKRCFVIRRLEVEGADRTLRGELLTIPFTPPDMLERASDAREAIEEAIGYAGALASWGWADCRP